MSFCRTWISRSAYDELLVVGSRWTRLLAKSSPISGPPYVQAHFPVPRVTVIPTLHVASIRFYDEVLKYMDESVRQYGNRVRILLEGICDADEDEEQQKQEYREIMKSPALQETMRVKADENTLFPLDVIREMCTELAIDFDTLQQHQKDIRLQECYLKPKMAATCGLNLFNDADLNMKEVQTELAKQMEAETAKGSSTLPDTIPVSQIGVFPCVRAAREKKVASVARRYCQRWLSEEADGEVIIPWGFFHTEQIVRHLCQPPLESSGAAQDMSLVKEEGFLRALPFGVPEAVLKTPAAATNATQQQKVSGQPSQGN